MLPAEHHGINLGPLFRTVADSAKWRDDKAEECFSSAQYMADELERYLQFAIAQGVFERFLPRLREESSHRDGAFNELATAFMFCRDGFGITKGDPPDAGTHQAAAGC